MQYRDASGATRRQNIGSAAAIEPDEARRQARDILANAKKPGQDAASVRRESRTAQKFGEAAREYLDYARERQKPSSYEAVERNLNVVCKPLHTLPLQSVSRAMVAQLHTQVTQKRGPTMANRTLAALSALFSWAIGRGYAENNPVIRMPRNVEKARKRKLTDDEIRTIWHGTGSGSDYDRIVRILLLTGTRRSEVGSMCWEELANDLWTIPAIRMKNSEDHEVPMTALALAQLPERRAGYPFVFGKTRDAGYSGWSRSKNRLDSRLKLPEWCAARFPPDTVDASSRGRRGTAYH